MPDVDLATILADGEYLKRAGDELVGVAPPTYSVARLTWFGAIATDASGYFYVSTGFEPTAALAVGTQFDFPWNVATILMNSTEVTFRVRYLGGTVAESTICGVSYVIFGPPVNP